MANATNNVKIVHIVPLGFERSTVFRPLEVIGGDRVRIITIGGKFAEKYEFFEEQRFFEEAVVRELKKMGFDVQMDYADLLDFEEAAKAIAKAIIEEKEVGGVYVNLSSHNERLISIISAIVACLNGVKMYYVLPERCASDEVEMEFYGISVVEVPEVYLLSVSESGCWVEVIKGSDDELRLQLDRLKPR